MSNKIIFVFLFFISNYTLANSCLRALDVEKLDKRAEVSFVGTLKVKSKFSSFSSNKYTLSVIKSYKGDVGSEVVVWSKKSTSSCGIRLRADYPYVVFAYKVKNELWIARESAWPMIDGYKDRTDEFYKFYLDKNLKQQ